MDDFHNKEAHLILLDTSLVSHDSDSCLATTFTVFIGDWVLSILLSTRSPETAMCEMDLKEP